MIRVTYKDEDRKIADEYKYYRKQFQLHIFENDYGFLSLTEENIVKIEKQAKDLTLEELEQLGLEPWYYTNDDRLIYVKKKRCLKEGPWELDDYIDITTIVKEE